MRDIMVKTGLHINTLRDIWYCPLLASLIPRNIADTQGRGCLEAFEFIVAMFYVENILNETMAEVPALLPPKIKDSAISAVASLTASPISRQSTFPKSGSTLNLATPAKEDWAIPAADLLKYGSFFDAIVPLPTGLMSSKGALYPLTKSVRRGGLQVLHPVQASLLHPLGHLVSRPVAPC